MIGSDISWAICKSASRSRKITIPAPRRSPHRYSRPTCNKLCAPSHEALDRRKCNPQARPSSFVDHTMDLPSRKFLSLELGAKFQRELPLCLEVSEFLYNAFRIGRRKLPCQKPALSVLSRVSIQYRLVTVKRTDTRR